MSKIFIMGLANIEVTCPVDAFPLEYSPIQFMSFKLSSSVSGVGYNLTKAFKTLGAEVELCTILGKDGNGSVIYNEMTGLGIPEDGLVRCMDQSFASVILYDQEGRRKIFCDLKNAQEMVYPYEIAKKKLMNSSIAVLCNTNLSRPFLKLAKELNIPIVTDVHVINDLEDEYHKEFLTYADILFMSHERLTDTPEEFVKKLTNKYNTKIVVVGLGKEGALLYVREDNFLGRFNAVSLRPVVNTVGAGDALLSSFVYFYNKDKNPYEAVKKAMIFAGNKIGYNGGASGFICEEEVNEMYTQYIGG